MAEQKVLCDATAAKCQCIKELGHVEAGDEVHACGPEECGGSWKGSQEDGTFEVVTLPGGMAALLRLLGGE